MLKRKSIYVIGTGTDVGKTYVTGLLLKELRQQGINAGYYKVALSGAEFDGDKLVPGDAAHVCRISGLDVAPETLVSYIYQPAVSPHLAANWSGCQVEWSRIDSDFHRLRNQYDFLAVEGSGGIVCPIRLEGEESILLSDVIRHWNLDTILVADSGLGTINNTVLTAKYVQSEGIRCCGIIMNRFEMENPMHRDNLSCIERLTNISVLGTIAPNENAIFWRKNSPFFTFG